MKLTLIGSTRFKELYLEANKALTKQGHLVYSVSFYGHENPQEPLGNMLKETLDLVHLMKISASDGVVLVTDDSNYFGDSTRRELKWATLNSKKIFRFGFAGTLVTLSGDILLTGNWENDE